MVKSKHNFVFHRFAWLYGFKGKKKLELDGILIDSLRLRFVA